MPPISPISLPSEAVIIPIKAIVIRIPAENTSEIYNVVLMLTFPCELINPTIRGILDRWQGERSILNIPQPKAARIASQVEPVIASYKPEKMVSIILSFYINKFYPLGLK